MQARIATLRKQHGHDQGSDPVLKGFGSLSRCPDRDFDGIRVQQKHPGRGTVDADQAPEAEDPQVAHAVVKSVNDLAAGRRRPSTKAQTDHSPHRIGPCLE